MIIGQVITAQSQEMAAKVSRPRNYEVMKKKKTRPQFSKLMLGIESTWNYMGFFHADSIWSINFENCGRVFFFERLISAFFKTEI